MNTIDRLFAHIITAILLALIAAAYSVVRLQDGPHRDYVDIVEKKVFWCVYWMILGILSSVGLGSGLHTFVLYLGPHIAKVTLAAYECGTLQFPEPPYPGEIKCPETLPPGSSVDILSIMAKVRLEAFMWGLGTAIGELPPYFMARTARLSGKSLEIDSTASKGKKKKEKSSESKWQDRMQAFVTRAGFFGILACASIPNPLFDLAGITCGYSLIPFWTFFGATAIGKAIVKMMLQKTFVIVAFSEQHFTALSQYIRTIPSIGEKLAVHFEEFLEKQKKSLHSSNLGGTGSSSLVSRILETIVSVMVLYFCVTIVNSMAQQNFKRSQESTSKKRVNRKKSK